jgi:multidrug efflux pump subunit AcrA (membrane-fusion protein)
MSSAEQSSVSQQHLEDTKQQIRALVNEINQLSKSELGPDQYFPEVLKRIIQALAAVGGAVWTMSESRQLKLVYQQQMNSSLLDAQREDAVRHKRLLDYVAGSSQPQLIPPKSGMSDERAGGNPTEHLLVIAPLMVDAAVEGVVEIFQRPNSQPNAQRGYLKFLVQMCEQIAEWMKTRKLRQFSDRHSLWAQADQYARLVHESLDLQETSYTIVNEGRRVLGCDRVSLAIQRGHKCVIQAISGQDTLDDRSNVVVKLGLLATRVVAAGEPLYYSGNTADMPPQLEEAVHDYVDESYSKSVTVLPIRKPGETETVGAKDALGDRRVEREILGALIIEQIDSELPREVMDSRIDLVYEHTTRAIANSLEHNNLFLMPVWRTIGKLSWIVRARTLPKTLTISAALLIVLIGLCVIPETFELQAKGALQPVEQRDVFVTEPGIVRVLKVKDGDKVKAGDVLVELTSDDLARETQRIAGELDTAAEEESSVQRAKLQPNLKDTDRVRLSGRAAELREKTRSLRKQLDLLNKKRELLKVTSPIEGTVVLSWDIEKALLHRPVERGQVLMSVADTTPQAKWELELYMPERRVGHVQHAQASLKRQDLDVTYIMATEPGVRRHGKIRSIHPTTHIHEQEGQTVRIKIQLDDKDLPSDLRPGASVIANIEAGRASIAYAKLHEAIEYVQRIAFSWF